MFIIPGQHVKNAEDRLVVLNQIAASVVEAQRGKHASHVFAYRKQPDHAHAEHCVAARPQGGGATAGARARPEAHVRAALTGGRA